MFPFWSLVEVEFLCMEIPYENNIQAHTITFMISTRKIIDIIPYRYPKHYDVHAHL